MKRLVNLITVSRMLISLVLPFILEYKVAFLALLLLCGATDVLDGYLARRWNCTSVFGARLDSIADMLLFLIITYSYLLIIGESLSRFYSFLAIVIFLRVCNLVIGFCQHGSFLMLHTIANKVTGLCIFMLLPIYLFINWEGFVFIILITASLSSLEEMMILLQKKRPSPDCKGLFFR